MEVGHSLFSDMELSMHETFRWHYADFSDYYSVQVNKVYGVSFAVAFDETAQKHRLFRSPVI